MADPRVEKIINFYELYDWLGSSGQPTPGEFKAIQAAGYQLIINLVPSDGETAIPNEGEIVKKLGLEYVHIPVIWDAPQVADALQFFDVMQANRGKKIFVHCQVNYRVSSFLYLYRTKILGVDEKQARQDLQWLWEPNATWRKFIEHVAALPIPRANTH